MRTVAQLIKRVKIPESKTLPIQKNFIQNITRTSIDYWETNNKKMSNLWIQRQFFLLLTFLALKYDSRFFSVCICNVMFMSYSFIITFSLECLYIHYYLNNLYFILFVYWYMILCIWITHHRILFLLLYFLYLFLYIIYKHLFLFTYF